MPKHIWTVVCYKACLDRCTNQVSILDVIEAITLPVIGKDVEQLEERAKSEQVVFQFPHAMATLWWREKGGKRENCTCRYVLLGPAGKQLANSAEIEFVFGDNDRARTLSSIPVMVFSGWGVYSYQVQLKDAKGRWRPVATVPVEMRPLPDTETPSE